MSNNKKNEHVHGNAHGSSIDSEANWLLSHAISQKFLFSPEFRSSLGEHSLLAEVVDKFRTEQHNLEKLEYALRVQKKVLTSKLKAIETVVMKKRTTDLEENHFIQSVVQVVNLPGPLYPTEKHNIVFT